MEHLAISRNFYENCELIETEIKIRAHNLIGTGYFCLNEQDDIAQELRIEVFKSLKYFNSKREKIKTYIQGVLKKKGIDLLIYKTAKIRQRIITISIENKELGFAKTQSEFFIFDEDTTNTLDLNSAIDKLPVEHQKVCRLLQQSYNISEIAKILNKSRTTIHKIIKDIRSYMCEFR